MSQIELRKMLDDHQKWLKNEREGKRLDLSYFDLSGIKLSYENLCRANLTRTNLTGADLCGADLRGADLSYTNLTGADLRGVDLKGANLSGAYLYKADLGYADLSGANLSIANLSTANLLNACLAYTNLNSANLFSANLKNGDLSGAGLFSANLEDANLKDIKVDANTLYYHLRCPEEGSYIGFKKCAGKLIVKLEIPADAYRSSATTNKCRASKAKVLEISDVERKHFFEEARSVHDSNFVYKVGEVIEVPDFNNNRWEECASGIHHFMTREEAIVY